MSVSQIFSTFCSNLLIGSDARDSIAYRTARLTSQLNSDLRNTDSQTSYRFYGGSYGRNTAIRNISDIDMMYIMPFAVYTQYDNYRGNGQSALLQAVRNSVIKTYPKSVTVADGQIVCIPFTDGITYEIVPAFENTDGSFTYADSNGGGTWKVCRPKHEIDSFVQRNRSCNGNLVMLGRMMRSWRDVNKVPMTGMLIDTLAYQFMQDWQYCDKSYLYYDWMSRDFFKFLSDQVGTQTYWLAPGSQSYVRRTGNFEYHGRQAHKKSLDAIEYMDKDMSWSSKQKWREIFGTNFPD